MEKAEPEHNKSMTELRTPVHELQFASLWSSLRAQVSRYKQCTALTHAYAIEGLETSTWQTKDNIASTVQSNLQPTNIGPFTVWLWRIPSVLWRCWLGGRKGIRPVKNWVVGCWCGYLSEAMCRPGGLGKRAVKWVCVSLSGDKLKTAVHGSNLWRQSRSWPGHARDDDDFAHSSTVQFVDFQCEHSQWYTVFRTGVSSVHMLWMINTALTLTVHQLSTVGRRAFAVHSPIIWNSLPDDLCTQQDYESFRQGLKTWLFSRY